MKFSKIIFVLCVSSLRTQISWALPNRSDPNSESNSNNWYIPTTTSSLVRLKAGDSYYSYNTVNSQPSSFMPTSSVGAQTSDKQLLYNQVYQQNQMYSPSGYTPQGSQLQDFSYGSSEAAEQKQDDFGGPVLRTAANIAEAIGLGGLGVVGGLIVLAVGGPVIALAVFFPVVILIVAILGFPVLQLTLPPSDPNFPRKLKSGVKDVASRAMEVIQSEQCIERLTCALARKARKLPYEDWILQKMSSSGRSWTTRLSQSIKVGRDGENCENFNCTSFTKMTDLYKRFKTS